MACAARRRRATLEQPTGRGPARRARWPARVLENFSGRRPALTTPVAQRLFSVGAQGQDAVFPRVMLPQEVAHRKTMRRTNAHTGMEGSEWIAPWVAEWGDKIAQFALAFTHDPEAAQDIAQETFLRLEEWHAAHPERQIHGGWLYTTARHLLIDHNRGRRRRPEVPWEGGAGAGQEVPSFETTVATRLSVQRTLDGLRPSDRECLFLFYYQEWSIAEIAQHLGVSAVTVRGRLFRARQRFARAWGGEGR